MIAPLRDSQSDCDRPSSSLAVARRAVAAMLFQRPREHVSGPPRVSVAAAWAITVWIALVAASFLALSGWWAIDRY